MYTPNPQQFSSGYSTIELIVVPTDDSVARMQRTLCEDLRYWAGAEDVDGSDPMFLRDPAEPGHIEAYPTPEVPFNQLWVPEGVAQDFGFSMGPTQETLLVAKPSHAHQLDRFYG